MSETTTLPVARSIHDVLDEIRRVATSERDKGDRFERLMQAAMRVVEPWATRFDEVWLWQEWPDREGRPDTGIDLVARERDGSGLCAIQCKCYDPGHDLQKGDIDSFFTASGKEGFTSRVIVSTTDRWSKHAEDALRGQQLPTARLGVRDLDAVGIDWALFDVDRPGSVPTPEVKQLRTHQRTAIDAVRAGLATHDRGKLVMACGTGKTFTALRLVEELLPVGGRVLFLVPSISLLAQSLTEWTAAAEQRIHPIAVCSDPKASRGAAVSEDASVHDLAFPATTNPARIVENATAIEARHPDALTVVFSTYQSIGAINEAQAAGLRDFDVVICDEAHRTTGVTLASADESAFVRIHDADFIRSNKRLYMTATPRIFGDATKAKANEATAELVSMDDERRYGPELHRLGFGEAVERGLLTDYKVLVLAVDEHAVERTFQRMMTSQDGSELNLDDVARIVGCWNGLAKRGVDRDRLGLGASVDPMRRAVAFAKDIRTSKHAAELLELVSQELETGGEGGEPEVSLRARHVDGTMNVLTRTERLDWLKSERGTDASTCRILTNARCLSEGVDVPSLDAVLFLNPRKSEVDVVQSVGRVMRLAPDKQYGYIILPVGIPADQSPEQALADNKRYQVVWQVLQALRAHDDRFDAIINTIDLNAQRDDKLQVIGVGAGADGELTTDGGGAGTQGSWSFDVDEWRDAIYARIVRKVGTREYWERWSDDVAELAARHEARIGKLVTEADGQLRSTFDRFVKSLRSQLNPSISEASAIQMLAQHLITKPVFEALFAGYDFAAHNPVAKAMQRMLDVLERTGTFGEEQGSASLQKFYDSVRVRAAGIDNADGKQRIIKDLYEQFFKKAFPKIADQLGIVYTPIEVVDWIIDAVDHVVQTEFDMSLDDEGIHVIDPFTGTGTFIVRLMESGRIGVEDLERKFGDGKPGSGELHANEMLLLAYYVAAINIEATFHAIVSDDGARELPYTPFGGILLTDTFLRGDGARATRLEEDAFPENNARTRAQDALDIRIIMGNPPYSAGQESLNDSNANVQYAAVDGRIAETYVARSSARQVRWLYDSYVRAIRWASDRIGERGVIAYVTNGTYIDANAMDGLRRCIADEFTDVWIYNLRGAARGSGDVRRREAGNVFGSGSRTPVAIMVLVRNPDRRGTEAAIHYCDIGDGLTEREKLDAIRSRPFGSVPWVPVRPSAEADWINHRDEQFWSWPPLTGSADAMFPVSSLGAQTGRDAWLHSFDRDQLRSQVGSMVDFFNDQARLLQRRKADDPGLSDADLLAGRDLDPRKFSWNRADTAALLRGTERRVEAESGRTTLYRPFVRQHLWFDRSLINSVYRLPSLFPTAAHAPRGILVSGPGTGHGFSVVATDQIPSLDALSHAQFVPAWTWVEADGHPSLLDAADAQVTGDFARTDNVNPDILDEYRREFGDGVTSQDLLDYVYGLLHLPGYRQRFAADLSKTLPRIPRVGSATTFAALCSSGRELSELHVNYDAQDPWEVVEEVAVGAPTDPWARFRVEKMRFARVRDERGTSAPDKSVIVVNRWITLREVPAAAHDYVLGPRSALEWVMERYQIRTDKASGIVNDPNAWSREVDDPRFVVDLLRRIISVSVETARIVGEMPPLDLDR